MIPCSWVALVIRFRVSISTFLLLLLLCPLAVHAQSMEPARLDLPGGGDTAILSGFIGPGTGKAFVNLAASAPQLRLLKLESPGGIVGEARMVARMVQSMGLDTYVGHRCASACTLIFYAGKSRWIKPDARLGFHGYAPGKGHTATQEQLDSAQNVERKTYVESGVQSWFVDKIFETPNSRIWLPSTEELLAARFATNVTVDDYPLGQEAHDGLPAVNRPTATATDAPLPKVIGP